jgi:hypothetical protein
METERSCCSSCSPVCRMQGVVASSVLTVICQCVVNGRRSRARSACVGAESRKSSVSDGMRAFSPSDKLWTNADASVLSCRHPQRANCLFLCTDHSLPAFGAPCIACWMTAILHGRRSDQSNCGGCTIVRRYAGSAAARGYAPGTSQDWMACPAAAAAAMRMRLAVWDGV